MRLRSVSFTGKVEGTSAKEQHIQTVSVRWNSSEVFGCRRHLLQLHECDNEDEYSKNRVKVSDKSDALLSLLADVSLQQD